jgi:hypothetical protein
MTTHREEQHRQPNTASAHARRLARTSLATAALAAGLAIGLAATANAEPIGQIGDEAGFNECVKEHPDEEGFAVCCVFYGGSLDEGPNHQACAIGPVTTPEDEEASTPQPPFRVPHVGTLPELTTADTVQTDPTEKPVLTRQPNLPLASLG